MVMTSDYVEAGAAVVGLFGMFVGGFGLGRLKGRSRKQTVAELEPLTDAEIDDEITRAASAWATKHGRPEIASLLADKVRLAWRLSSQRNSDTRGW